MLTTCTRRSRPRLILTGIIALCILGTSLPSAATARPSMPSIDTLTWSIDANTLRTANIQEDGVFSDGDEPYVGVVAYRSRFGTPGSTSARFLGGLRELSGGADDGDVLGIPDAMGRATFSDVNRVSDFSVVVGVSPEVVGTITIAMESDATPWSSMSAIFNDLARVAQREIGSVIETTTLQDFWLSSMDEAAKQRLADRFEGAVSRIESGTKRTFWEDLGLWLSSWSDPDDKIAFKFTAFVAVDESLAPVVDTELAKVLPADKGIGGALRPRSTNLTFSGDGARYDVGLSVSS